MTFLSGLYTLIISPLVLLFEVIFTIADRLIGNAGLSIIVLSLAVNFLVLPLYKRADELQAEERDIQAKMAYRIKRTKQTFKGDERFFMLQEYYRINNYKPVYALKSSVSLLLQIPFFIAAYRLLSGMQSLQGVQFGLIRDLGKEDAAFMIGNFPVNILPVLMTLINIISGIIYTKGHPLKSKIQVYGLAVVFLVLLYHSPSGLVFYWLLNNVFSLVKNIFYKLKDPKKALGIILAAAGAVILVITIIRPDLGIRQKVLLGLFCILLALPLVSVLIKNKAKPVSDTVPGKADKTLFFSGAFLMALVTGLFIPSVIINASTEEFINVIDPSSPLIYIARSLLLSLGSWVLWGGVFFAFSKGRTRQIFSMAMPVICGISIIDYMLFGTDLGNLSSVLQYDTQPAFSVYDHLFNLLAVALIALICIFLYLKVRQATKILILAGILSITGIGIYNVSKINYTYSWYENTNDVTDEMLNIPLNRNGRNVIVLFLDRALGTQVPYIFNEKPELLKKYEGFTYYPNTISYGPKTNFASPALYGGYEYTPGRINERSDESLTEKQNEALKVMPVIFGNNGFDVTVCNPKYAGYKWIPDLSIYDDYPDFHCYNTNGQFGFTFDGAGTMSSLEIYGKIDEIRYRNFFCFSLMKISPLLLQETLYDGGMYNRAASASASPETSVLTQTFDGVSKSTGYNILFIESYPVLTSLSDVTTISDSSEDTFLMMSNDTPHSPCILQEPDYVPAMNVDNTAFDTDMVSRYTVDGKTMKMESVAQVAHYHVNMATFLKLGEWFDYLRENGVYDNTRIILVADHGRDLGQFDIYCNGQNMECFLPLLMVKDFDSTGFAVSDDFMTNGDVPLLATAGLIDDPVNPFTGNPITDSAKTGPQTVYYSPGSTAQDNDRNTFLPGSWFVFEGEDPHDPSNWKYVGEG